MQSERRRMMATLINGNGNLAIYAQQDADWYASIMGGQTVITGVGQQFEYSLLDANTIGVSDGVIITKEGRRIQLDVNEIDTFDIPSGAQGTTNYYIIGYHLVTGDQSEQTVETFVQLMENGSDTIPEGSFREGDDDVFVSLYRVQQNDLALGTITLLLPKVDSLQSQIDGINADLTDQLIASNDQKFRFDYQNGEYGYVTESGGADTFVPFKNWKLIYENKASSFSFDVSSYNPKNFIIKPKANKVIASNYSSVYQIVYVNGYVSISGNTATFVPPRIQVQNSSGQTLVYGDLACDIYWLG
jgi:hypothetical protein